MAIAFPISFMVFACGCFRDADDMDDEDEPLLTSLSPVAMRAYAVLQVCLLAPLVTFLLVKWEPINGDIFSTYWCEDTMLLGAETDWAGLLEPFDFNGMKDAVFLSIEDVPRRTFFLPWLALSYSSISDMPKMAFFVKCYPTPQDWFGSMSGIFAKDAPKRFAEIRRSYHDETEDATGEETNLVDYTCSAPTSSGGSIEGSFCGSRCLLGTHLEELACTFAGGQKSLSCSCCKVEASPGGPLVPNPELSEGPEFLCSECCDGEKPRIGRLIESLDLHAEDQHGAGYLLDDGWVRDASHWEADIGLTPLNLWWWINPFGVWAIYALIIVLTAAEMSPVANATTLLCFWFFYTGIYGKNVLLLVQFALTLVADRRGAELIDSLVHDGSSHGGKEPLSA